MTNEYLNELQRRLLTGSALEHGYRPALQKLIEDIDENITAVNDPKRSTHGNPDFIFFRKDNKNFILGYAETKDLNIQLDDIEKSEQLKRYLGYSRLILTNYVEFRFFRNGEKYQTIEIARKENSFLKPIHQNFLLLEKEIVAFLEAKPERIKSGIRLAQIMGGKALRIRENVIRYLDTKDERSEELERIYKVMKNSLVHDLTISKFADMYAQTLVYGLFVARYYDDTPEDFSRREARDLVPASNPFLQQFFDHIVGTKFDQRLAYIVDELCEIFSIADIRDIIRKHFNLFGEAAGDKDPIIHFYEDFLKEYDPKLRKEMGAYYTPIPVVNFIIRAVDDVLVKEFKLDGGIANIDKITQEIKIQGKKSRQIIHRVQILDPAVGTATFLNETIKHIYSKFKDQGGLWESYVSEELLPRLYGFELMMAPYTIAHLKLAMTLKEMGIGVFKRRLGVYLTNTLEEGIKTNNDLFSFGLAEAISEESKAANEIKNNRPIMVVIANPPYSGVSSNETDFANNLVKQYKVEPGGLEKLHERKHWLNDDYVKFIAFAEKLINKNGEGVLAMITNHGYLDNPTFRGMRWHLAKSFEKIYVLDLHGNSKKNEKTPDGNIDNNIFEIMQGVSIIVAFKTKKSNKSAEVYRSDLWGRRQHKLDALNNSTLESIKWNKLNLDKNSYGFILDKDLKLMESYKHGIDVSKLFITNSTGIVTMGDNFIIAESKEELKSRLETFFSQDVTKEELRHKYKLGKNYADWIITNKKRIEIKDALFSEIAYRPYDNRWTYYDNKLLWRPRTKVMDLFHKKHNYGLMVCRQQKIRGFHHVLLHKNISESSYVSNRTSEIGSSFPLYIYDNYEQISLDQQQDRRPNLEMNLVRELLFNVGEYRWIDDHKNKKDGDQSKVSPLDVLDYVYAILHSNKYRKKYEDFLRENFPRVPAVLNSKSFWKLVELGGNLRNLHLMEDYNLLNSQTKYPIYGDDIISDVHFNNNSIWINKIQYFKDVSKEVWEFYVGGYKPAQKWLKDRRGKKLNFNELTYYQKIIKSIEDTIKIMNEIDTVFVFK